VRRDELHIGSGASLNQAGPERLWLIFYIGQNSDDWPLDISTFKAKRVAVAAGLIGGASVGVRLYWALRVCEKWNQTFLTADSGKIEFPDRIETKQFDSLFV